MPDEFREHLFTYEFQGRSASFSLLARSAEDAQERLKAVTDATYDGELVERVELVRQRTAKFLQEALNSKG